MLQAWLTEINEYAQEDVVIMLLGNKADMAGERLIKTEDGEKLAKVSKNRQQLKMLLTTNVDGKLLGLELPIEPYLEKAGFLHVQKQRHRSAAQ